MSSRELAVLFQDMETWSLAFTLYWTGHQKGSKSGRCVAGSNEETLQSFTNVYSQTAATNNMGEVESWE